MAGSATCLQKSKSNTRGKKKYRFLSCEISLITSKFAEIFLNQARVYKTTYSLFLFKDFIVIKLPDLLRTFGFSFTLH